MVKFKINLIFILLTISCTNNIKSCFSCCFNKENSEKEDNNKENKSKLELPFDGNIGQLRKDSKKLTLGLMQKINSNENQSGAEKISIENEVKQIIGNLKSLQLKFFNNIKNNINENHNVLVFKFANQNTLNEIFKKTQMNQENFFLDIFQNNKPKYNKDKDIFENNVFILTDSYKKKQFLKILFDLYSRPNKYFNNMEDRLLFYSLQKEKKVLEMQSLGKFCYETLGKKIIIQAHEKISENKNIMNDSINEKNNDKNFQDDSDETIRLKIANLFQKLFLNSAIRENSEKEKLEVCNKEKFDSFCQNESNDNNNNNNESNENNYRNSGDSDKIKNYDYYNKNLNGLCFDDFSFGVVQCFKSIDTKRFIFETRLTSDGKEILETKIRIDK